MAKTPPLQSVRELPVSPISYWETVDFVKAALDQLERGQFRLAAHLCDAMLRDDRIQGVMATRLNGLLGLPLEMDAGGEDAPKKKQDLGAEIQKTWPLMFPEADLKDLSRWGIMLGFGLAQMLWDTRATVGGDRRWVPKIDVWHPSVAYWDWGPRIYRANSMEKMLELPEPDNGKPGDGAWVLYTPFGYKRGYNSGAVRALALPWLVRGWARRDWARQSETNGSGIKVAEVPIGASKEERKKFVEKIAQIGTDTVLEAPVLPNGQGKFDLRLVEALGRTFEGFQQLLQHADTAIAIVLLGQNLTTEVQQGSRAAAQVHDSVRKDFQQADARTLGRCLQDQVLRPYAQYNVGDEDLAPFPAWQTDPPEDVAQRATALKDVGSFLTSAKQAGAPVDVRTLLDELGIPLITPEQEAQNKADDAERAAAAQAALAKAQQLQPGQKPPGGTETEPPDDGEEQQLSDRDPVPPGAHRGQRYIDDLGTKATEQGAKAIETDLHALLHEVQLSSTPEDLRNRLVRRFGTMNPNQLAALIERSELLADLAGRRSVLEDVR